MDCFLSFQEIPIPPLNSLPHGKIFHAFLSTFRKILSGIPSECQTDWIQIRPDILSDLIWVQIVCKSYWQTTLGDRVKFGIYLVGISFDVQYIYIYEYE